MALVVLPDDIHDPEPVFGEVGKRIQFAVETISFAGAAVRDAQIMPGQRGIVFKPVLAIVNRLSGNDFAGGRQLGMPPLGSVPALQHRTEHHFDPQLVEQIHDVAKFVVAGCDGEIAELACAAETLLHHGGHQTDPAASEFRDLFRLFRRLF